MVREALVSPLVGGIATALADYFIGKRGWLAYQPRSTNTADVFWSHISRVKVGYV
jgi:hypothetical protein